MDDNPVEILAIMIPIIAIVFVSVLVFAYFLFVHLRRRRLIEVLHEQRMAALSKGVELPPLPEVLLESGLKMANPGRALFRGLVWSLVGLGAFFALRSVGHDAFLFALIPIGVGLSYLAYYWIEARKALPPPTDTPDKGMPALEPAKP